MIPTLSFRADFHTYAVAALGCVVLLASEPVGQSPDFANGNGPGLFKKLASSPGAPLPVTGSDTRRFYSIATLVRDDGTEMLVALGCLTADILTIPDDPIKSWQGGIPQLYLFASIDGDTWTQHPLPSETGAGRSILNTLMQRRRPFAAYTDANGRPAVIIATGAHLVSFDGSAVTVYDVPGPRARAVVPLRGKFYTLAEYSSATLAVHEGVLVVWEPGQAGTVRVRLPRADDAQVVDVTNAAAAGTLTIQTAHLSPIAGDLSEQGAVMAIGRADGLFYAFAARRPLCTAATDLSSLDSDVPAIPGRFMPDGYNFAEPPSPGQQTYAALALQGWPEKLLNWKMDGSDSTALDLDTSLFLGAPASDPASGFGANLLAFIPDEMFMARAGNRLYVAHSRPDFYAAGFAAGWAGASLDALLEIATVPVWEILLDGAPDGLNITATLPADGTLASGALLGTADGYIAAWDALGNRAQPLAHLTGQSDSGAVLQLLQGPATGEVWALLATGFYFSVNGGRSWVRGLEPPTGYAYTAMQRVGGVTFLISTDGTDSRVDRDGVPDTYLDTALRVTALHDGLIIMLGSGGVVVTYAGIVSDRVAAAALSLETVQCAKSGASGLWVGCASGKVFLHTGGEYSTGWVEKADTGEPVSALLEKDGVLYLGGDGGLGSWWRYDIMGDTLETLVLPGCAFVASDIIDIGDEPTIIGDGITPALPLPPDAVIKFETRAYTRPQSFVAVEILNAVPETYRVYVSTAAAPGLDLAQYRRIGAGVQVRLPEARHVTVLVVAPAGSESPLISWETNVAQ